MSLTGTQRCFCRTILSVLEEDFACSFAAASAFFFINAAALSVTTPRTHSDTGQPIAIIDVLVVLFEDSRLISVLENLPFNFWYAYPSCILSNSLLVSACTLPA
jgi:hypothetical protein